jgi:hypothetical protein
LRLQATKSEFVDAFKSWSGSFIGACQLPQSPGVSPANCIVPEELTHTR